MFVYTRAFFKKLVDDIKGVCYIFNVISPLIYIGYLIYAIFVPVGYLWANITLLGLTLSYLIFYLITYDPKENRLKSPKKNVRHIYKAVKLTVTGMTLGITVYGIYVASTHTTLVSILLSCFMAFFWLCQVIIELLTYVIEYQAALFLAALEADKDNLMKPLTTVGNFVKKVRGKDVPEPKSPSKILRKLESKVREINDNKKPGVIGRFINKFKKDKTDSAAEEDIIVEETTEQY